MTLPSHHHHIFYGTTTVGEKGQIVIPADARKVLKLKKGEKLLVFSMGNGMLALTKLEHLAKFQEHLLEKLASIQKAVKSVK